MGHKRIGAPTTRTPIPSPAHQCTAATGHEAPLDTALTPLPISPPTSGPAAHAAATNLARSARTRRSGGPLHQANTSDAPTTGSTELASANPDVAATPTP